MRGKCIMLQGTGSSVGKSLLVTALCRIFKQDGLKPAPFKSQNMALNSYITKKGDEMGRAQVVQAEAAGIEPDVSMNPVLLKPTTDQKAQVVLEGRVYGNMSAAVYHDFKPQLAQRIIQIYQALENDYDVVVLEGAGSPAEINLRDRDIVNMGMAEMVDAPVILIGDIDKGGVFASLAGTMLLLTEDEKKRVKGVIINKFRGDLEILKPGLVMLEDIIKIPVLGVIPYMDIEIEDEDSVTDRFHRSRANNRELSIKVVRLPHISNFTDFNAMSREEDVSLEYFTGEQDLSEADMIIIPGSKNTIEDLAWMRNTGIEGRIVAAYQQGAVLAGICGGYQMLGKKLMDPLQTESNIMEITGMGLLDMETTFEQEKVTTRVTGEITGCGKGILDGLEGCMVEGYEIHMGQNQYGIDIKPAIRIHSRNGQCTDILDGTVNAAADILGTYIHGIFDNAEFLRGLLNNLRIRKGLGPVEGTATTYQDFKEQEYDRLADTVRQHLDMDTVYRIVRGEL